MTCGPAQRSVNDQARAELESALRLRRALAEEFPQNRTDAAALSEIERLLAELNRGSS